MYGDQKLDTKESGVSRSQSLLNSSKDPEVTVSHDTYRLAPRPLIFENTPEPVSRVTTTPKRQQPLQDRGVPTYSLWTQDPKAWLAAATEQPTSENEKMQIHPSRLLMLSQPDSAPLQRQIDMPMHETGSRTSGGL